MILPSQLQRTALWIAELQMMKETEKHRSIRIWIFYHWITNAFIVEGNSLQIDWEMMYQNIRFHILWEILRLRVLGVMSPEQKDDVKEILSGLEKCRNIWITFVAGIRNAQTHEEYINTSRIGFDKF